MKKLLYHAESDCLFVAEPTGADYDQGVVNMDPTLLRAGADIAVDLGTSTVMPSMDFETYSEAGFIIDPATGIVKGASSSGKGGLPVIGTPNYAAHPTTEVLC
ncbi:MAG: hypothetical protein GY820_25835, partial [Gammaproteobacteria bacterium]|nr:hypothetical protein [Gammaproteobacteria bacterium]